MAEIPKYTPEQKATVVYDSMKDRAVSQEARAEEKQLKNSIEINNLNTPELVDAYLLQFQTQPNKFRALQSDISSIQASWQHFENLRDGIKWENNKNEVQLQWLINNFPCFSKIGALNGKEGNNRALMSLKKEWDNYILLALTLKDGKPFGNGIKIDIPAPQK